MTDKIHEAVERYTKLLDAAINKTQGTDAIYAEHLKFFLAKWVERDNEAKICLLLTQIDDFLEDMNERYQGNFTE